MFLTNDSCGQCQQVVMGGVRKQTKQTNKQHSSKAFVSAPVLSSCPDCPDNRRQLQARINPFLYKLLLVSFIKSKESKLT